MDSMAQATNHSITRPLSTLFRDPFLRAAFVAAERDGLAPLLVETDRARIDGGAIVHPELVEA
jgi:hypothetical protein